MVRWLKREALRIMGNYVPPARAKRGQKENKAAETKE